MPLLLYCLAAIHLYVFTFSRQQRVCVCAIRPTEYFACNTVHLTDKNTEKNYNQSLQCILHQTATTPNPIWVDLDRQTSTGGGYTTGQGHPTL
jgi:hypothetical protein